MKKSLLPFLFLLLLTGYGLHAQGSWNFAAPTDGAGTPGAEQGRAICSDASGNIYCVGQFTSTSGATDFDLNSSTTNTFTSSGGSPDGYIVSYDKNGVFRWKTIVSGAGGEFGAPSGNVCTNGTYVWFAGTASMSGAPQIISPTNTVTITSVGTGVDALVGKLDCSSGGLVWYSAYGSSGADHAEGICYDPSGCVYVTGGYTGSFTLNSITTPATAGLADFYIAKFSPGGTLLHFNRGGSAGGDNVASGSGVCYVPGATPRIVATGSTNSGGSTFGGFSGIGTSGGIDALLIEIDSTLTTYSNALAFGGSSTDELLSCVYDPFSGAVYTCGYYSGSSITFPNTAALPAPTSQDLCIARYNVANDNFDWSTSAGGTGTNNERAWSITTDGNGGILIGGTTSSSPTTFGSLSLTVSGGGLGDVFVVRYNTNGTAIWVLGAGGSATEEVRGITSYVTSSPYSQTLFTTGIYAGASTFGSTTLNNDGGNDFFVASINDASFPLQATQSHVNLTCNGVCTGSATVVASGGTAPYTYSWSPSGGSGATASNLCAINYTCTITDASLTSITKTFSITQPGAITSSVVSITNVACNGGSNGAATITSAGGTGTRTFSWSPAPGAGQGTQSISGLIAATYTCTITDANSCTHTQTVQVTQPLAISSSVVSQTNVACFGGSNGAATINASGGTGTLTYSWSPAPGAGQGTASISGLSAQLYTCTITDANSCTHTQTVNIIAPLAITSSVVSQTNVSCFGGSNGAATITASGGTGTLLYNWNPGNPTGDGTVSVTGLNATQTWTCTITDANSCVHNQTVNITQPSSPVSGTTVVTNVACFGGNTGAINLTPTGGTPGYTFNWLPSGPITEDRTNLVAGTYSVQITDANGCTGTVTATVTQPTSPVSGTTVVTNVACFGGNTGAINLTPTGGTPGYTFNWLPSGPITEDRTNLVAGTYSVQITDANGCTGTVTATVTQPTSPVSGTTVVTNVACFGGNTGAINLTPTGGTGPYTENWLPSGPTTEDRTNLIAGTYSVQITDANGCTGTVTATVTQPTSPVSGTTVVTNVACFGGNTGAINLTPTGGTAGYTFNWLPSGPITEDRTNLVAGTYSVQITDANGCTGTVTATVTQPTSPVSGTTVVTNVACFGGNTGAINLTPTGGTPGYTFNWLPSGPTTEDRTNLVAGTYSVQITDANGCTGTVTATVTEPTVLTVTITTTNVNCNSASTGSLTAVPAGGTPAYAYFWTPGNFTTATISNLPAQCYTVTVTDSHGCMATAFSCITQPPAIVVTPVSQTNISCNGGSNGAASVSASGGTGTLTYDWTPGSPSGDGTNSVTGLTAQVWTCTVMDANSCTSNATFNITEPTPLSVSSMQTNVSCNGGNNGDAMVMVSGGAPGYIYAWSPSGGSGATASGLTAGNYSCLITDANGCTVTQTFSITEPSAMASSNMQTNVSCNGGNNGDAMVMVTGGTGSYTYSWSPVSGNTDMIMGLTAGNYSCLVTDGNGCTITETFAITEPPALSSSDMQTDISCNGGNNGDATVSVSGGTGAYTYTWSPSGGTGVTESNLTAGNYSCTITDANGCTLTETFLLTEPPALSFTTSQTNISCNGGNNGDATVSVSGGTGAYTYAWSPSGGTGVTESNLAAGNYSCIITDANSCQVTATFTITEPTALTATIDATNNPSSCGASDGSILITVSGGTTAYNYSWSNSASTEDVTGIPAGGYTCTITDANGCSTIASASLSDPNAPTVTLSLPVDTACGNYPNTVNLSGGSPAGGTFSGTAVSGNTFDPVAAGMGMHYITYTYTDPNGCTGSTLDSIFVETCIGIVQVASNGDWTIFPNPTNGIFTITSPNTNTEKTVVEVYSAEGQLVLSQSKPAGNAIIDLQKQPVGIYFVRITNEGNSKVYRLVKI